MPINYREAPSLVAPIFDPLQSLLAGQQFSDSMAQSDRAKEVRSLQDALAGQLSGGQDATASDAYQKLLAIDPASAERSRSAINNLSDDRKKAFYQDAQKGLRYAETGNLAALNNLIFDRQRALDEIGGDRSDVDSMANALAAGDFDIVEATLQAVTDEGISQGFLKAPKEKETEYTGFSKEETLRARKVKAGLIARAGSSSAERIAQNQGLSKDIVIHKATEAAAKETAKLNAQFKLKPKVQEAVTLAVASANLVADDASTAKSNKKALDVYQVGIDSLSEAMSKTSTNPIVGGMPALTANAQSADGAISMMAPVMKAMFRESGEGTFTKDDQEILLNMLPTRKDLPAARAFKLKAVDAIVRMKFGANDTAGGLSPEDQAELDSLEAEFGGQ